MPEISRSAGASGEPSLSVFFLIRSMDLGGAQRQLLYLARGLRERGHRVTVAVYYPGVLDDELRSAGVELVQLGKRSRWDMIGFVRRLVRAIRAARPDLMYSFLGTSNILAALLKPLVPGVRMVWSVRSSNMDARAYDVASGLSYRLECVLSRRPDLIISNSRAGLEHAVANGFPREKLIVIPNGIDTERFRPDEEARVRLRTAWCIGGDERVIGILARLDPMKDHRTFIRAAARVAKVRPNVRFICAGDPIGNHLEELQALTAEQGMTGRLSFVGPAIDPVAVLNGFDICCSSSAWGEGFSNSIAEAMACDLPCVVTDVGDSAAVVGDSGRVVPPGDPAALADALLLTLVELDSGSRPRPRDRIAAHFSLEALVDQTQRALQATLRGAAA